MHPVGGMKRSEWLTRGRWVRRVQREAATTLTALTARPDLNHLTVAISVAMCIPGMAGGGAAVGAGAGAGT